MTNFYEELDLDCSLSLDDLNKELSRSESVWKSRRTKAPEKATKMLGLIYDAREVFKTEETRRNYDIKLGSSAALPSDGTATSASPEFDRWYKAAVAYFEDGQADMAMSAIEKALSHYDPSSENDEFLYYVAHIQFSNENFQQALGNINEALLLNPSSGQYIELKGRVLSGLGKGEQALDSFKKALEIYESSDNSESAAFILGYIANVLYNLQDYAEAADYAERAVALGDPSKLGQAVLNSVDSVQKIEPEDIDAYRQEPSAYTQEIEGYIKTIISSGIATDDESGWSIIKKHNNFTQNPNRDGFLEEEVAYVSYYLGRDGKFHSKTLVKTREYINFINPADSTSDWVKDVSINTVMEETDIDAGVSFHNENIDRYSTTVEEAKGFADLARRTDGTVNFKRKSLRKGKVLRDILKAKVDAAEAQIAEAKRIAEEAERVNAAFNAEFTPAKEKIVSKYDVSRKKVNEKYAPLIQKARSREPERTKIANTIASSKKELSSLGIFKAKRKKELQEQISQLEKQLAGIQTVSSVETAKKNELDDIKKQESQEIGNLERTLRAKYPLPVRK